MFKKVRARYFSTLLVIFLFIFVSTTSIAAQNAKQVLHTVKDTILIASEPSYPPFCIVDEDGNADGFSVDLIKAVAEVMHLNLQIKVGPWDEIKQELVEGKIDALPLVGRSPETEEVYDFTFPYHTMNGAVFVRKGTKGIETLGDLKQKDIAVMQGDNAHEFVTRVKLSDKIHTTETYDIAFKELSEGKYDAVIAQELIGLQLVNELNIHNVNVLDIELTGFNQDFSFAVQEGDKELLSVLNDGLSIIVANGTYDELQKKWWEPIIISGLSFEEKLEMLLPYIISIIFIIAIIAIVILELQVKKRTRKLRKEIAVRNRTEIALKESEKKYRNIFENVLDMFFEVHIDGVIVDVSPSILELSYGQYKRDDLIGKSMYDLYADPAKREAFLEALQKQGSVADYEIIFKNRDGSEVPCSISARIQCDPQGTPVKIIGSIRNITDRKQAEEALRTSEAQLSNAMEIAKLGYWEYDADSDLFTFNDHFYDIFRTTAKKVGGYTMTPSQYAERFLHPDDIAVVATEMKKAMETTDPNFSRTIEHRIIYADGEPGYISVRFFIAKDSQGRTVKTFGANQDITERKQAEEELKINRERLKTANSILRHDITNDLVVIKSAVDIYREEGDESMIDEIEKRVEKSIETIHNQREQEAFINSHAELDEYDIEQVARDVIKNYPDIKITVTGTSRAYADNAIYSVFENIIGNAIRHGKTSKLDIEIIPNKENCEIRFKDYGIGIPDEIKDKIFDEGFKYGETGHTGIGLYIVQTTVEEYGGMVFVEDNEPQGVVFIIRLKKTIEG